jgi:CMP-N-acetylneuraminic acid synthetase
MSWLALMPLRGGSKSIPGKNLRELAGRPLFAWSLEQALRSAAFDRVVVASDAPSIRARVSAEFGAEIEVVDRSAANATDEASSEAIMLEVAEGRCFDVMALVQGTSPLTLARHFAEARDAFERHGWDSLLSVVTSHRFYWTRDARPLNYDPRRRPRRQDWDGTLIESGAFYFTRRALLLAERCRLGGRIGVYEMPASTLIEIDEPADLAQAEAALAARRG